MAVGGLGMLLVVLAASCNPDQGEGTEGEGTEVELTHLQGMPVVHMEVAWDLGGGFNRNTTLFTCNILSVMWEMQLAL